MPLITIIANKNAFVRLNMTEFADKVRSFTAQALNCDTPNGKLTIDNTEAHVVEADSLHIVGSNEFQVKITVEANDYPERKSNLAERSDLLESLVKEILPKNFRCYIWVKLSPAEFRAFNGTM